MNFLISQVQINNMIIYDEVRSYYMNNYQKYIVRLAKLEMKINNISFYKAKKKAMSVRKSIGDMLINKYGFKIN
ncbi:hypothetical protein RSJ9_2701 [Clostridium botulinum]|nr:hypothetical protein RSJ9_2701 [Clostridium botulinum]